MSRDRPRPSSATLLVHVLSWWYGSRLPFSFSSFYFHGPHVPFCPQTLVGGTPVHPLQSSCSQMPKSLSWQLQHLLSQKVLVLFFSYTLEHSVMFQLPWSCHCTPWLHHLSPEHASLQAFSYARGFRDWQPHPSYRKFSYLLRSEHHRPLRLHNRERPLRYFFCAPRKTPPDDRVSLLRDIRKGRFFFF